MTSVLELRRSLEEFELELSTITPQQTESGHQTPASSAPLTALASPDALRRAIHDNVTVQELAPVDRGVRAWTFCGCSFVLEMFIWGFCFSYGIFQDYYTTHPPFNTASSLSIAAVGTIAMALQYAEALSLTCLLGRYPDYLNLSMWVGLVLYFLSIFCSSFATQVWHLILLQGVVFGIAGGLLYVPTIIIMPEWFSARRGLAGGIIFAGGGVGGFIFPFALNALLDKVGFRWGLRIWSIVSTSCCALALLGIRPRLPVPKFTGGQRRPRFIPPQLGFTRNPLYWGLSLALLLQGFSYFPVSLYIASYTRALSDPLTATIVLSIFNSSAVAGQIVLGHLSDLFPYPWIMFISAIGSGVVAFLLWGLAKAPTELYFFAIFFGALNGGFSSTWYNAAFDCAGGKPEHMGIAIASTALFKGVSAVVGPILSGILLDAGKGSSMGGVFGREGYGAVEIFVGSCAFATGAVSLFIASAKRRAAFNLAS